jgi:superoxide oxidase
MIALPVLGILARQAEGAAVTFLGWTLPIFIANDKPLSRQLEDVPTFLGNVMLWLVVLHVVAALYHAFVRRDNALARMLGTPARRGAGTPRAGAPE